MIITGAPKRWQDFLKEQQKTENAVLVNVGAAPTVVGTTVHTNPQAGDRLLITYSLYMTAQTVASMIEIRISPGSGGSRWDWGIAGLKHGRLIFESPAGTTDFQIQGSFMAEVISLGNTKEVLCEIMDSNGDGLIQPSDFVMTSELLRGAA